MKKSKHHSFLLWLIGGLFLCSSVANAQCKAINRAFRSGEQIDYVLYYNWKFIWIKVGDAYLKTKAIDYDNRLAYKIDLLSNTSKRADRFFKMRDTITSIVSDSLQPIYYRKGAHEGKRYTVDEVNFRFYKDSCHLDMFRLNHKGKLEFKEKEVQGCVYDMLSILAKARSFDVRHYKKGERIQFELASGAKIEHYHLVYLGKKNVKAKDRKTYRCLSFRLLEQFENKEEKKLITFFITDDDNHIPVRLDMHLSFGSAKAFLKRITGNRHPISSSLEN
jgi:hypothetical protein